MARLIDADKICVADLTFYTTDHVTQEDVQGLIDEQPTVDTARHGHWSFRPFTDDWIGLLYICSECKDFCDSRYRFCPSCGAKMDGFEEIWEDDRDRLD